MKKSSQVEQQLMKLIIQSGKSMTKMLEAFEKASDDFESSKALWQEAQAFNHEAHTIQTHLIQQEIRQEGVEVSLLAVHAQDHFMNSFLVSQIGDIILKQQRKIAELEQRLSQLEKR